MNTSEKLTPAEAIGSFLFLALLALLIVIVS